MSHLFGFKQSKIIDILSTYVDKITNNNAVRKKKEGNCKLSIIIQKKTLGIMVFKYEKQNILIPTT